jgi:drug efflux transport system permease protein
VIRNIYHLALKEFLHLIRDRRTLAFLILIPSILTVIFGYAIGNPRVTAIRTRVLDLDGGRLAYEYVAAIRESSTFKADVREQATEADVAQADEDLLHDRISAFVVLPKGLSASLDDGRSVTVKLVVDGSDTFMAPSAMGELAKTTVQQNLFVVATRLERDGKVRTIEEGLQAAAPIELATDYRFNPDLKSQNFVMPGVIGLILQLLAVIVMATSIARERERGTLEQLAVTPLSPAEIFIGKLIPYFVLALLDTVNALLLARILFGISLAGHYPVVITLLVVFVLSSLGIGQLISTVSKNQGQAVLLAVFYVLPAFVLSGAFTPIETQPEFVRPVSLLFPLTYFCHGFRAALLRQASFEDVAVDLLALGGFVVLTFGASILLLRTRPDVR